MNVDPAALLGIGRRVETVPSDGSTATVVIAHRTYPTDIEDLWDAVTSPERLPRWFAPVSGELRRGGHYQVQGNAGGEVLACEPPRRFELTWVFGDQTSWVSVELTPGADGAGTTLELRHTAIPPEEFHDQFGPGAVGVGWDLSLVGLGLYLATGAPVDPAEAEQWSLSPQGRGFITAASDAWADAAVAGGEDRAAAQRRAGNVRAFYLGELPSPHQE